jgi:hypothetical protein
MTKVWRQGDVVIREIDEGEYERLKRWRLSKAETKDIVIKSETGNPHILHTSVAQEVLVRANDDILEEGAIATQQPILVEHPQHGSFTLPSGKYLIYRVREANIGLFGNGTRVLD